MFHHAQSILAACLALKQRPYIRYQSSSESAGRLAREVLHQIEREDQRGTLFDYRGNCQLVIMDRKSDPITPLLMQWLYLGMIHEFMPIWNNRVKLASGGKEEEFVLNAQTDDFLKAHKWDNFGDLYTAVKQQTDAFAAADKRKDELLSGDWDKKMRIRERYGDVRGGVQGLQAAGALGEAAHLAGVGAGPHREAARPHHDLRLGAEPGLQQRPREPAQRAHATHRGPQRPFFLPFPHFQTSKEDAIRLAVLYALHYEQKPGSKLSSVLSALRDRGISDDMLNLVNLFLRFPVSPFSHA